MTVIADIQTASETSRSLVWHAAGGVGVRAAGQSLALRGGLSLAEIVAWLGGSTEMTILANIKAAT